jgi:hypothetical protein
MCMGPVARGEGLSAANTGDYNRRPPPPSPAGPKPDAWRIGADGRGRAAYNRPMKDHANRSCTARAAPAGGADAGAGI